MAESSPVPALPSTADPIPYVPISWMAVAALTVSVVFAATLLVVGLIAFVNKKPLLEHWLMVLPVAAIVMSFAARRMIRNSEGTRTGETLAVTAWWLALILGLCYIAYLFAYDFAISQDAKGEGTKWMANVTEAGEDGLATAFYRTIPPGGRQGLNGPTDIGTMRQRFRDELLMFRESDLLKLAQRNQGKLEFTPGSVSWSYRPGTIDCTLTGTVKCPEGTFPVVVPLKGVEGVTTADGAGGGRQWMVERPRGGGFIDQSRAMRTPYGWLVESLEATGTRYGMNFVQLVVQGPTTHPYAYRAFVAEGRDGQGWIEIARDPGLQFIFAAPAHIAGGGGYAEYMRQHFYKLPGGAEPQPDQKSRFFNSWNFQSLRPPGDKFKTPDGAPIDKQTITITDTAIEVRVPVEIPIPGTTNNARARLVVVCNDPAVLAELKRLRESADPDQGTAQPPAEVAALAEKAPWRVVRIESDMVGISVMAPRGPGMGPEGMPEG